jgi:predicted nucleotidyltransferase
VFGAVLRDEDDESSGLDLLVDPMAETTLLDVASVEAELQGLLGVRVDVLTPGALPDQFRARVRAEAVAI